MTTAELKVGCIGTGTVFGRHAAGWAASDRATLIAVADVDSAALHEQREQHDIARAYADPAALIADPDIDIVDVCAPNRFHADYVIAALDAGKHAICQKPLAPTTAQIRRIIEARDRSGKLVMTAQQYRFASVARTLKTAVDAGRVGNVYHARCWYLRRAGLPVRTGLIYKRNSGGGACTDIGVHVLDLCLWLMGNPQPAAVTGAAPAVLATLEGARGQGGAPVPTDIDVEEFAAGFVRFANGATLSLEVSWLLHHNTDVDKRIWLYGDAGGLVFPDGTLHDTDPTTFAPRDTPLPAVADPIGEYDQRTYSATLDAFAAAVQDGGESPVPPEQSLQVQAILEGIYRSHESGREVRLD